MSVSQPVERLTTALDELAAADPADLDDTALRSRLINLTTATNRLYVELARTAEHFDRRGLASLDGFRTARAWLQALCRHSGRLAHRLVKTGRLLTRLPKIAAASQDGQISAEHLQHVSQLADQIGLPRVTPAEATLADAAQLLDPSRFAAVCHRVRAHVDPDGPDPALQHQRRGLTLSPLAGMHTLKGQLDAEGGATLQTALDALMTPPGNDDDRTATQRRADAIVELARRQLTTGNLPTTAGQRPQIGILLHPQALSPHTLARLAHAQADPAARQRLHDIATDRPAAEPTPTTSAIPATATTAAETTTPATAATPATPATAELATASPAAGPPETTTSVETPAAASATSAVATTQTQAVQARATPTRATQVWSRPGWADPPWLAWHGPIHPTIAQRIACDADIWRVIIDPATSQPLDVGRAHRIVPHWIRKALYARDRGCRWPGCPTPAEWTDAHHLTPWADGGETSARQCILLCRHHHVLVHEGRWRIHLDHTGEIHLTRPGRIPCQSPATRSLPWTGPSG